MTKIIVSCVSILHELWMQRCQIIHMKLVDGIEIEEKVDLINELKLVRTNGSPEEMKQYNKISDERIGKIPTETIKGILFEYYSLMGNKTACKNLNIRSLRCKARLNEGVSEEGYVMWERQLELIDKCKCNAYEKGSDDDSEDNLY